MERRWAEMAIRVGGIRAAGRVHDDVHGHSWRRAAGSSGTGRGVARVWRRRAARVHAAAVCLVGLSASISPPCLVGQQPATVTGSVRDLAGRPLPGADVFLLETLEGTPTDSAGVFRFTSTVRGPATLVVQHPGHLEVRRMVELPLAAPVSITMQPAPVTLEAITVEAGTYRLGNLPDVTLDELEVVYTPGAAGRSLPRDSDLPGNAERGRRGGAVRAGRRPLRDAGAARRRDGHLALPS